MNTSTNTNRRCNRCDGPNAYNPIVHRNGRGEEYKEYICDHCNEEDQLALQKVVHRFLSPASNSSRLSSAAATSAPSKSSQSQSQSQSKLDRYIKATNPPHQPINPLNIINDPIAFALAEADLISSTPAAALPPMDSEEWYEAVEQFITSAAAASAHPTRSAATAAHQPTKPRPPAAQGASGGGSTPPPVLSCRRQSYQSQYFEHLYVQVDGRTDYITAEFDKARAFPTPRAFVHTATEDEMLQCVQQMYMNRFSRQLYRIRDARMGPYRVVIVVLQWRTGDEVEDTLHQMYSYPISK